MTREEAIAELNTFKIGAKSEPGEKALDMAIKALEKEPCEDCISRQDAQERQRVAQKRRYTFGNDEFSLEAAYHDCKLVFDGITDDDSFQEADTGLILYYANEIIYALHEALKGKGTNVHSNDYINRQQAIDAVKKNTFRLTFAEEQNCEGHVAWSAEAVYSDVMEGALLELPSAQPEPCEDAVSRKAVYGAMVEKGQHSRRYKLGEIWELNGTEIREALDTVPSVTPGQKRGKWEKEDKE